MPEGPRVLAADSALRGRLRLLAQTTERRSPGPPEVPTFQKAGLCDLRECDIFRLPRRLPDRWGFPAVVLVAGSGGALLLTAVVEAWSSFAGWISTVQLIVPASHSHDALGHSIDQADSYAAGRIPSPLPSRDWLDSPNVGRTCERSQKRSLPEIPSAVAVLQ
jgi:hypothetical protein